MHVKHGLMILLITVNFIPRAYSKVQILMASPDSTKEEFEWALNKNKHYLSYAESVEATAGALTRDEIALCTRASEGNLSVDLSGDSSIDDQCITKMGAKFMSPLRKYIMISLLEKRMNKSTDSNLGDSLQLATLHGGPIKFPGPLNISINRLQSTDLLYLNGILISQNQWKQLSLFPNIFYNVSIISNSFHPIFRWAKGEELEGVIESAERVPLLKGTCLKPELNSFNESFTLDSIVGIYPQKCINAVKEETPQSVPMINTHFNNNEESNLEKNTLSSSNHYWQWGFGVLLLGLMSHELRKNQYEIRISF